MTWRPLNIWIMRGCIVTLGCVTYLLRFHTPIGEQISLMLLGIPTAVWLFAEVNFAIARPPIAWLERQGRWSYSLYLVHPIAIELTTYVVPNHFFGASPTAVWLTCLAVGLCFARIFFTVVEQPFHRLARAVSLLPARRPQAKTV
jgi:peptidoglycan/LPS O-acetylase OafA/YrhL